MSWPFLAVTRRYSPLFAATSLMACGPEEVFSSRPSTIATSTLSDISTSLDSTTSLSFTIQGGKGRLDPVARPRALRGSVTHLADGSKRVGLESWYRDPRDQMRPRPAHVMIRSNGSFSLRMSNGDEREINTAPNIAPQGLSDRDAARALAYRNPALDVPRIAVPSATSRPPLRLPRDLLRSSANDRLARARAYFTSEVRVSPTRLQFSSTRGKRTMRMTFDETLGAEVELDVVDENGRSVIRKHYLEIPGGVRLHKRETLISGKQGTWTIVDHLEGSSVSGGTK